MHINFLLKVFEQNSENDAIVWQNKTVTYQWLLEKIEYWTQEITSRNIGRGAVAVVCCRLGRGHFAPDLLVACFALFRFQKLIHFLLIG